MQEQPALVEDALQQHVGRMPLRALPPLVKLEQRASDCVRLVGRTMRDGEPDPAPRRVPQIGRAEPEEQPLQRGDDTDCVLRVGERAQHHEQLAQLVLLRETCAGRHHRDVPLGERTRVALDRLLRGAQHHEVARALLPRVDPAGDPARHRFAVERQDLVVLARGGAHDVVPHAVAAAGLRLRFHRAVGRLLRRGLRRKHRREVTVDDCFDRAHRPEVRRERQHDAERLHPPLHQLVDLDVGAPEAVDALLRVAHDEQSARARRHGPPVVAARGLRREEETDLRLDGVRVLELVHQQVRVARAELVAHGGVLAQQSRGEEEQVLEAELAGRMTLAREVRGGTPEHVHHHGVPVLTPAAQDVGDPLVQQGREPLAQFLRGRLPFLRVAPPLLRGLARGRGDRLERVAEARDAREVAQRADELQAAHELHQRIPSVGRLVSGHRLPRLGEQLLQLAATGGDVRRNRSVNRELDVRIAHDRLESLVQLRGVDPHLRERGQAGVVVPAGTLHPAAPEPPLQLLPRLVGDLLEVRVERDLERALAEQPRAEGVDGTEEGAVELAQRTLVARPLVARGIALAKRALETHLESLAQLVRRLARERHRREPLHRRASPHVLHHSAHERRRLAGARARFDQHVDVQVRADALTRGLVARGPRHASSGARRAIIVTYCDRRAPCSAAHSARGACVP